MRLSFSSCTCMIIDCTGFWVLLQTDANTFFAVSQSFPSSSFLEFAMTVTYARTLLLMCSAMFLWLNLLGQNSSSNGIAFIYEKDNH